MIQTAHKICVVWKKNEAKHHLALNEIVDTQSISWEVNFNTCNVTKFCNISNSWIIDLTHRFL